MALLRCQSCESWVSMTKHYAQRCGWTVKLIPLASISSGGVEEVWTCPSCSAQKAKAS